MSRLIRPHETCYSSLVSSLPLNRATTVTLCCCLLCWQVSLPIPSGSSLESAPHHSGDHLSIHKEAKTICRAAKSGSQTNTFCISLYFSWNFITLNVNNTPSNFSFHSLMNNVNIGPLPVESIESVENVKIVWVVCCLANLHSLLLRVKLCYWRVISRLFGLEVEVNCRLAAWRPE